MAVLTSKSLKLNKFLKLINIDYYNKSCILVPIKMFSNTKYYLNVDKTTATPAVAKAAKTETKPTAPEPPKQQQQQPKEDTIIPKPHFEGETKTYTQKIQNLVNEISKLTLIEVSDLNELLRKTLNIKDVPMYSAGPAIGATPSGSGGTAAAKKAEEDEAAAAAATPVQQKSSFKLKLVKFDEAKKVALIKEVKSLNENMNLVQAKKFIESLPQVFRDNVGKDEAEKFKAQLEKVGATCVIE